MVDQSDKLLLALRYLVQDFYLGGSAQSYTMDQLFTKIDAKFIADLTQGDFLSGVDKDLLTEIYPIRNLQIDNELMHLQKIRMDDGYRSQSNITLVRLVNGQPTINKN